jgi:serine/threonine protein kinase
MGTAEYENEVFIIMEYMERGSLKDLLAKETPLNLKMTLRMAIDIAQGMHYLHTRQPRIIHGDLKTANILVNKDYNLKVSDFNFAKFSVMPNKLSDNLYGTVSLKFVKLLMCRLHGLLQSY